MPPIRRRGPSATDDGWVINGSKMWISLGNYAKLALIFAQTDPEKGNRGLACFLVETEGNEGFQPTEIHHKLGLRGSDTAAISLIDCTCRRTRCSARSATASRWP